MFANGAAYAAFASIVNEAANGGFTSGKNHQDLKTPQPEYEGKTSAADEARMSEAAMVDEVKNAEAAATTPKSPPNPAPYSRTGIVEEVVVTGKAPGCSYCFADYLRANTGTLFAGSGGGIQRDGIYDMVNIGLGAPLAGAACVSAPAACWGAAKGLGITHATNQFLGVESTPTNLAFGALTGAAVAPYMPYLSQGTRVGSLGWDVTLWGAGTGAGVLVP